MPYFCRYFRHLLKYFFLKCGDRLEQAEVTLKEIYEKENIVLPFSDKLEVVVQRIYQHYKGYSTIDEVRDMNIDRSIWTEYLDFQKAS